MRISDWSSDVCSSDLSIGTYEWQSDGGWMAKFMQQTSCHRPRGRQATSLNLAQRPDAKHGIGHETLVARGQNVRPCPNLAAFDTKRDRQTPHPPAPREIGRAECRDRVCQEVLTSVVAGAS